VVSYVKRGDLLFVRFPLYEKMSNFLSLIPSSIVSRYEKVCRLQECSLQVPLSSQPTPIASLSAAATPSRTQDMSTDKKTKNSESVFPQSFPLIYGPLDPTAEVDTAVDRLATSASATPRPQQTPRTAVNSGD
jgi:hypothetical protein